jgi:RimJ/RimL family protein N-acetyltransferase
MRHELLLAGPVVTLRPLRDGDAAALVALTLESPDVEDDLRWHTSPLPVDERVAATNLRALVDSPTVMPFAVVGTDDGTLRGITTFYDHVASVPRVEIGHTHYGRRFWGGETNPASKLLLMTHAFEVWGVVRVALRCDAANERSAGAIRRLGATPEGVLRNHRRRHDGTVGDTAYFAVTEAEWPAVRAGLRARVSP